jgi:hypothetical protein
VNTTTFLNDDDLCGQWNFGGLMKGRVDTFAGEIYCHILTTHTDCVEWMPTT